MFIKQTLYQFMDNPMGRGSNAIPARKLIRSDLNTRLDTILKHKKINYVIYREKDNSRILFHLKIPSETTERKNTYDVVIQFDVPEDAANIKDDSNLLRYETKFFSNSPSFTYTYAYAFSLYGLLVDQTDKKFDRAVLNNPPLTRNPAEVINYEKTIYFATRFLEMNPDLLQKTIIVGKAKILNMRTVLSAIRKPVEVELEIKLETQRLKKEEDKKSDKSVHSRSLASGVTTSKTRKATQPRQTVNRITAKKTNRIKPKRSTWTNKDQQRGM